MVFIDYSGQEQILRGQDGEKKKIKYKVVNTVEFFCIWKSIDLANFLSKKLQNSHYSWQQNRKWDWGYIYAPEAGNIWISGQYPNGWELSKKQMGQTLIILKSWNYCCY